MMPPGPLGDEQSIVVPVMRISVAAPVGDIPAAPPDVRLLGFTILHLDQNALSTELEVAVRDESWTPESPQLVAFRILLGAPAQDRLVWIKRLAAASNSPASVPAVGVSSRAR